MVLVATQVKRRRGTTAENDAFTGAEGEITVDLTKKTLRVHDGSTQGGTELARMSDIGSGIDKAISNCITEIPQDIKLELNNGTLTLKAGSKVYVPNGAGVFDVVNITSDVSISSSANEDCDIFLRISNRGLLRFATSANMSGTTTPTGNANFYNTSTNTIHRYNSGVLGEQLSFPLARVSYDSNGVMKSIDQVFNGFGYIGSTVFALPNVKGLIPNGRNADGSLKNQSVTIQNVLTRTIPSNIGWHYITINEAGTNFDFATNFYSGDSLPSNALSYSRFYNTAENQIYTVVSGVLTRNTQLVPNFRIEHSGSTPYNITSMRQITPFHALDYNDSEYIAHNAMPSDRRVNLTLGASGSTYTAPADGWIVWNGSFNNSSGSFRIQSGSVRTGANANAGSPTSVPGRCYAPAIKGSTITCNYNDVKETFDFLFVYAEGSK